MTSNGRACMVDRRNVAGGHVRDVGQVALMSQPFKEDES